MALLFGFLGLGTIRADLGYGQSNESEVLIPNDLLMHGDPGTLWAHCGNELNDKANRCRALVVGARGDRQFCAKLSYHHSPRASQLCFFELGKIIEPHLSPLAKRWRDCFQTYCNEGFGCSTDGVYHEACGRMSYDKFVWERKALVKEAGTPEFCDSLAFFSNSADVCFELLAEEKGDPTFCKFNSYSSSCYIKMALQLRRPTVCLDIPVLANRRAECLGAVSPRQKFWVEGIFGLVTVALLAIVLRFLVRAPQHSNAGWINALGLGLVIFALRLIPLILGIGVALTIFQFPIFGSLNLLAGAGSDLRDSVLLNHNLLRLSIEAVLTVLYYGLVYILCRKSRWITASIVAVVPILFTGVLFFLIMSSFN